MKKNITTCALVIAMIALLVFTGCAAGDVRWHETNPAGFWAGLWHGMIVVVTFIISLFSKTVEIYERANNGGWYDFGFILGILLIWGGSSGAACRRRSSRRRKED
ncbi:hypothetical protein GF359_00595 [candidate division WOR-3 bacterium]|uniref:Lipoprotein n=1 Tax=candidate division WOR-3 bacterium TaxID=2052148 RepID=A0A9D5K7D5_UNCW3|nr:hypothetical protein [candidate division WOR-3 bacterium]MBD3363691.1 hypothetical protein [candidate division WOR-3 bacterium]